MRLVKRHRTDYMSLKQYGHFGVKKPSRQKQHFSMQTNDFVKIYYSVIINRYQYFLFAYLNLLHMHAHLQMSECLFFCQNILFKYGR